MSHMNVILQLLTTFSI